MAYRTLELTLISAKDLRDVNVFSKMDVYAVATIAGDHRTQQRTPVDRDGGKNPSWNSTLRFSVPADPAVANRLVIHVLLRAQRALGDRDVGEVHIPLKELLDGIKEGSKFVSYQVRKPGSGKAKGVLNLSYKFVDIPASSGLPPPPPVSAAKPAEPVTVYPPPASQKPPKENEPVMAYPAAGASGSAYPPSYPPAGGYPPYQPQGNYAAYPPPPQGGYGYGAPPQAGYGYGAPPPQGYGYGAPPAGYGYGAVPPRKNKNNLGLGLGAGLLGGALGGMLIGDMISDDGAYDAGYDAGFDDGGFGF
ncbi:protein SRC2-like [Dendrobium catenatum]|uniref:C2 domain-containing protein n=1 Tax=Dendrobium catenatum TaxID=906689 RepID=A0A2I0XJ08_9ASPA|nr:protein SRC2-like [Dendrobium catenatum]PKU87879.1 C2 domain-containing protein [Dendrobium catenatum]